MDIDQPIRFEMLGPLRAWRDGAELDLGPTKQRAVLAFLLLDANRPVTVAQIIDAVGGDEPPENGPNVVQKYVSGLRRTLEPGRSPRAPGQLIGRTDVGYCVTVDTAHLDVEVFRGQVRRAQAARAAGHPTLARTLLTEADTLWRAEPLAGLTGPAFDTARQRLEEERAAAREAWAELEVEHGDLATVVPVLRRLVADYPLREQLRYLLIMALYRSGRQAEALAGYRETQQFLAEEFGVDPGEALQALHRRVLRGDPTLNPVSPPVFRSAPVPAPPLALSLPINPTGPGPIGYRRWWQTLLMVLGVLVPIFSIGILSWAVILAYALVNRSVRLGLAVLGYGALLAVFAAAVEQHNPAILQAAGMVSFVASIGLGTVHSAYLAWTSSRRMMTVDQRIRRETARAIFHNSPVIARQLHIGRPDLPPALNDGGVLDVNTAPEWLLAALPGIGLEDAAALVRARRRFGTLASEEQLFAAEHFRRHTRRVLHDCLIYAPLPTPPAPDPMLSSALAITRPP